MDNSEPIAIVGMAGIFPGASDVRTFWKNILDRVDAAVEVPQDRWVLSPEDVCSSRPEPDKALSRRACPIRDFRFDPSGIDLPGDLMAELDPLYHLVLHAGRDALSESRVPDKTRKRTGVVLAAIALPTDSSSALTREIFEGMLEKRIFKEKALPSSSGILTANRLLSAEVTSLPAALLARGLGLGGGAYTLDAACASSLFAVKLACDALRSGRTDMMLAGGVSRPDCLYTQIGFSQLRALSPSGRCAPFDRNADGLMVGEGAGILVLKRLVDALRDGDTVCGLIRGIGLSNDTGGSLLAPESTGQLRAMRKAYEKAGWIPQDVDCIECHGAGTPVGDGVELSSLKTLWGESGWIKAQCAIGSVKSMIGHLLTAAGAAGTIKMLCGLRDGIFPPSLHFREPAEGSPLMDGPFRVQTEPQPWPRRDPGTPRRGAVSAFGFGGINAHLLLEEWRPEHPVFPVPKTAYGIGEDSGPGRKAASRGLPAPVPAAIVGMAVCAGTISSLGQFKETVFRGETAFRSRPEGRWRGWDRTAGTDLPAFSNRGAYLEEVGFDPKAFRIPPGEIPDILPQHLLMLQISADALADAGMTQRQDRLRMSAVIGMGFDFAACDFHLRWSLAHTVEAWKKKYGLALTPSETKRFLQAVRDAWCPALTSTRTQGALGGLIASRIAKEFRLGGPSFGVSQDELSGIRALSIGMGLLVEDEAEAVLVGAVDLCGDIRNLLIRDSRIPFSRTGAVRPFDEAADGPLPGEGSVALVIKRLDRAVADKDRIYAVIRGTGQAGDYLSSLRLAFEEAGVCPESVELLEAHGSGAPLQDRAETTTLHEFFAPRENPCAVGSAQANIGHTGAAAGLFSVARAALCLYQEMIPALPGFRAPADAVWEKGCFHLPAYSHYWARDRADGPRRACVAGMTAEGACSHLILEGFEYPYAEQAPDKIRLERKRPMGREPFGLFTVEGDNEAQLHDGLNRLEGHLSAEESISGSGDGIEETARAWYLARDGKPGKRFAVCVVAGNRQEALRFCADAREAVLAGRGARIDGRAGFSFSPSPLCPQGELALVFPGSGNHFIGMGRKIGTVFPEVLRRMDAQTLRLNTQSLPGCYVPRRASWAPGWEEDAHTRLVSDPLNLIFGQVFHGGLMAGVLMQLGIRPTAVIGYSLGESAGLFAAGAWPDRGEMLERMRATDLFSRHLAGEYLAVRKAWNLPENEALQWWVAAVNRPAEEVKRVIGKYPRVRLLIVNTPEESVIGGCKDQVERAIRDLNADAVLLEGVVAVHCDAARPVEDAYRDLHRFPTHPPAGIRFYSCAADRSHELTSESAASSITAQAVSGFDFTALIDQAYRDGVRIFLETGPHSSCTRMIRRILKDRPHLAVSASTRGEDEILSVLKALGNLMAEGVPVDLESLYGKDAFPDLADSGTRTAVAVGGIPGSLDPPIAAEVKTEIFRPEAREPMPGTAVVEPDPGTAGETRIAAPFSDLLRSMRETIEANAEAHRSFLELSQEMGRDYAGTLALQTGLMASGASPVRVPTADRASFPDSPGRQEVQEGFRPVLAYTRDQCMEFAVGSAARVLGPEFSALDTYPARVRLPDEPLMLVDRILSVEGEKGSLGTGRIVTEHDVIAGAWYLDADRAPVCISVEAGQADLFLSAYLGIDLAVKGERTYRLLDASVKFHRGLPRPGEVIRYEIEIEKFVRQGDTYLFFFHFDGTIGNTPLITMRGGCAGFFTPEEVRRSGGILLTEEETRPLAGKRDPRWKALVPILAESYTEDQLDALRSGDLAACFGPGFAGIRPASSVLLPGGRMKLIDRVLRLDPEGGRYGLGLIRAEADIHADDWFLTCHFVDDRVMPGTLMYECCAHTLRVFLQRMGWVAEREGVCYEPVPGVESRLKCRGPVTPETRKVVYQVEIGEIGCSPEPFVTADALMLADGRPIVQFKNMSLKLSGMGMEKLQAFWDRRRPEVAAKTGIEEKITPFDRDRILAFCIGKPSEAFGEPYRVFDRDRVIARLPGPPYLFMDRVVRIDPPPWVLQPDGWVEAQFDVLPEAWYFRADRSGTMPFGVLLEIALQPCGWLAAWVGSALKSGKDLKFRNLGGTGTQHGEIFPSAGTLSVRVRMTGASAAGDTVIEHFDFRVSRGEALIYEGNTYFGFFTAEALGRQVGLRDVKEEDRKSAPGPADRSETFGDHAPLTPEDPAVSGAPSLAMPAKAIRMIDAAEIYKNQGNSGQDLIRGLKKVDPQEWFFKAHFYQDPVCPGSLGIESFIQLLKFAALDRFPDLSETHRFAPLLGKPHQWTYRGQILPENREITVEASARYGDDRQVPFVEGDGFLKVDGLHIYRMEGFGVLLVARDRQEVREFSM